MPIDVNLTLRANKATPLTWIEGDANWSLLIANDQFLDQTKVDKIAGKGLSTNDLTNTLKNKLDGIADGATKNATDAQLRDRSTHTGVQPMDSITGLNEKFNTLIKVANPNDTTPGRLVTPGWMGFGTVSGNRLPGDNAQVAVPAGEYYTTATWTGSPYPGTDGRNQGYLTVKAGSSADYMAQTWEPLRRSDAPMMHRYSYNGQWQAWQIILSGVRLQSSANMDQRLIMRDVVGIGTPHTYCLSIDAKTIEEGLILGYSYVNSATVGAKPGGYVFGVVNTVANQSDHLQQDFIGLNGVPGATQRAYRRTGYGGTANAWGPWRMVIDSASAQDDVETLGGVVSRTIVSGIVVNKFISGLIIINGSLGVTQEIAAGAVSEANITLPASVGPDVNFATPYCIASPYNTNDWFGITNSYMSSPTNLKLILRNGATAQKFSVRGIITGHWK